MKYKDRIKQLGIFLLAGLLAVQPVSVSAVEAGAFYESSESVTDEASAEQQIALSAENVDAAEAGQSTGASGDAEGTEDTTSSDASAINGSTQQAAEISEDIDGSDEDLIYEDSEQSLEDDTSVSDTDLTAETDEELVIDESLADEEETDETEAETEEVDIYDETVEAGDASDGSFAAKSRVRRAASNRTFQSCYGDQLSGDARGIYDAFVSGWTSNVINEIEYSFSGIYDADSVIKTTNSETGDVSYSGDEYDAAMYEVRSAVQAAFDAFLYDNPEVYWLKRLYYSYTLSTSKNSDGTYYLQITKLNTAILNSDKEEPTKKIGETWGGAISSITEFQNAVDAAASNVNSRITSDMSDAQKMKVIHDYICEISTYKEDYLYAHTAYGTFMTGEVVCEGYAKAFKILCNRLGIACVLGAGDVYKTTDPDEEPGKHMWNYVTLNGQWYMVDATWDDKDTKIYTTYLFAGAETSGYYKIISEERKNYTTFSNSKYSFNFTQPSLAENTYHETNNWTIEVEATCTDDGQKTGVCVLCGEVFVAEIPALGHDTEGESWIVSKEATCTDKGYQYKLCTRCGETGESVEIAALGHDTEGVSWIVSKEATCTDKGYQYKLCTRCGEVGESEEIAALGHDTTGVAWTVSKVATCTETGTRVKACKTCGTVIETETIPAKGHSYGSYVVTQPATIFAAGVKTRTCSSCGKKETASIAKIAATVKLTAKSVPLKKGQSIQAGKLIAKKFDEDSIASVKTSNKNVVSVSGTKLTGKKAGKSAKITIKMKSGASATITVKVQKSAVSVTKLTVAKKSVKLKVGQKYALNAQLSPVTCTKKITYSSNKKKIAAVSSKGVITAKKKGAATITVKAGKKTVKVKVRVTK